VEGRKRRLEGEQEVKNGELNKKKIQEEEEIEKRGEKELRRKRGRKGGGK
jgi:hypothetical protein